MFGPLKTENSCQSVLFSHELAKELKRHKLKQAEQRMMLGTLYFTEGDLVFERGDGFPYAKSTLHRAIKRIDKKANITKNLTIHSLRHTHAVMMLELGASLKEVQEHLVHKSIQATADVYAHISHTLEKHSKLFRIHEIRPYFHRKKIMRSILKILEKYDRNKKSLNNCKCSLIKLSIN